MRILRPVLHRIYGKQLDAHDYGTTLSSAAFAGTIVGMLVFGYLTNKIGTPVYTSTRPSPSQLFSIQDGGSEWLVPHLDR